MSTLYVIGGLVAIALLGYLRVYMAHLRRKLEPDPVHPRIFRTDIGVGYRLLESDEE